MNMNVDAFILARLDSSRLPRKHLLHIENKPIIQHLVERISKCKTMIVLEESATKLHYYSYLGN